MTSLRPSNLPKLAVCPKYRSSPGDAGLAAQRGTLIDEAFRDYFLGNEQSIKELDEEIHNLDPGLLPASEGTMWAINYLEMIANGSHIETNPDRLKVIVEEMDTEGGEMDADIPSLAHGFDMKSGQIRNYKEQMAAYALGRMRESFLTEYKMTLLYSDQREVTNYVFKYEDAERIVSGLREDYYSNKPATPCDYCNWCGARDECNERKELATKAGALNIQENWEAIKEDPDKISEFLLTATALDAYVKEAKQIAKDMLIKGNKISRYTLRTKRGNDYVEGDHLIGWALSNGISTEEIIRAFGQMPKGKFVQLAEQKQIDIENQKFSSSKSSQFIQKTK